MIQYYQRTIKDDVVRTLDEFKIGSWILVENPTPEDLEILAQGRGLDLDLLRDALDPNEVPRVELENGITYMFTRVPVRVGEDIQTSPVLFVMAGDFLLTLSIVRLPFLERILSGKIEIHTTQKAKLLTQLFGQVTALYGRFLTDIARRVRGLRVRLERIENNDIQQLIIFESILNEFMAALVPTQSLLKQILSGKFFQLYEKDQDLVEDVTLANNQLVEMCTAELKNTVNIRDAYSTIMTNNLNRVIKILTALTVVFAIPTMVSSFYGMNVLLPGGDNPTAYAYVLAGSLALSVLVLGVFARNRWL